jgi:hypothetical protein
MPYVLGINLIPMALLAIALFFHCTKPVALPKSKRALFGLGIVSGIFGAVLLIGFLTISFVDPSHVGYVNVWGGRVWIAAASMAIVSFPLSCMGKGPQRLLAVFSSLTLVILLYVGGLATSI